MYSHFDKFIFRAPLLANDRIYNSNLTDAVIFDFNEAIYISSLDLYNSIHTSNKSHEEPLFKYFLRAKHRCTPFGLFAGIGVGNISDGTSKIFLNELKPYSKHITIDFQILLDITQFFCRSENIRSNLTYYLNSTTYAAEGKIRYILRKYNFGNAEFLLNEIEPSKELVDLLLYCKNGRSFNAIIDKLKTFKIVDEKEFLITLIDSQILVSELEVRLTGTPFFEVLNEICNSLDAAGNEKENMDLKKMKDIIVSLHNLCRKINNSTKFSPDLYHSIVSIVESVLGHADRRVFFSADVVFNPDQANLNEKIIPRLHDGIDALNKLSVRVKDPAIAKFKADFIKRWDNLEIPLLLALDPDSGIGYKTYSLNETETMDLGGAVKVQEKWKYDRLPEINLPNDLKKLWNSKIIRALQSCSYEIELNNEDLSSLQNDMDDLPDTLLIIASIIGKDCDNILHVKTIAANPTKIFSRFAQHSKDLQQFLLEIEAREQQLQQDHIFAEIVFLPENVRMGNISHRRVGRDYEIPVLSLTSSSAEKIPLSDIVVSVRNDAIVLRSKLLDKQIIPTLTTLHNYQETQCLIYSFLCDLQHQGELDSFQITFPSIWYDLKFKPRIVLNKNVVLQEAKWDFEKNDFFYLSSDDVSNFESFRSFKEKWQIPRHINLVQNQQRLFIDTEDIAQVRLFHSLIRKLDRIRLHEAFINNKGFLSCGALSFESEFVVPFYKSVSNTPSSKAPAMDLQLNKFVEYQTRFFPGQDWVYFKLFVTPDIADRILRTIILPLVEKLVLEKLIKKWFFIRYLENGFHLRIRFHLNEKKNFGKVVEIFNTSIQPLIKTRHAVQVQIDTYDRETLRYYWSNTDLSEDVFAIDSDNVLALLYLSTGPEQVKLRLVLALRIIHIYLECFVGEVENKLNFVITRKNEFISEFKDDKELRSFVNKTYKAIQNAETAVLHGEFDNELLSLERQSKVNEQLSFFKNRLNILACETIGALPKPAIEEILKSYIHMSVNRICAKRPRENEFVLFCLMERIYRCHIARKSLKKLVM